MEDKDYLVKMAVTNMLNRSVRIFKYNGLPDTIPQKDLELILQVNGNATWARDEDNKLYVFAAGLGGEPNPYYLPTLAVVANPALRLSKTFTIDKDCVVMLNDTMYQGLMPMFSKYAHLLAEAELSLKYAIINARVPALVQADNDGTYESAVEFFKKIVEGKEYGIISSKEFFDGIKTQDYYRQAYIKDLIESIQYIKGSWYSEIGLNAAFNMKREAINEAEASLNEDVLYPTIDTMLECRKIALDKINAMFGTNISVELDSIWKFNREHDELSIDVQKAELEQNKERDGEDIETDRNTD